MAGGVRGTFGVLVHFLDLGVGLGVCSICENSSSNTVMVNALFCSLLKYMYISVFAPL